tara:strand:+ start:318 stop:947 length:630 start_codon:yes stop_codon:yes gene_type:complete
MKNLIRINLNQTVSKTELQEKRGDLYRWVGFYSIATLFLILIIWQSIIISRANDIIADQKDLKKIIKKETGQSSRKIAIEDIEKLKDFHMQERIFWGPKLSALISSVTDDMAITSMELIKRRFKMTVYARVDSLDKENTAYKKGKDFESRLKDSKFVDYFKTNSQGEPIFSAVKYEDEIVEGNELHKIVFEGELKQTFKKARRGKKRKK